MLSFYYALYFYYIFLYLYALFNLFCYIILIHIILFKQNTWQNLIRL